MKTRFIAPFFNSSLLRKKWSIHGKLCILGLSLSCGVRAQTFISGDFYISGNTYDYSNDIRVDTGTKLRLITGDWVTYSRNMIFAPGASILNESGSPRIYADNPLSGVNAAGILQLSANGVTIPPGITFINGNPSGINLLAGDLHIAGALQFASAEYNGNSVNNNMLSLNDNNLVFTPTGTVTGADGDSYVVTNNTGKVSKQGVGSGTSFTFPVGNSTAADFTPATITNGSTVQDIHVRVGTYSSPTFTIPGYGALALADGINRTWEVTSANSIGNLTFTHNSSTEGANYAAQSPMAYVTQFYSGSYAWTLGTPAAESQVGSAKTLSAVYPLPLGTGTQYYSKTTNTSIALPLHLLSFKGQSINNCSTLLSWETADASTVDHYEVYFSTDGRNFQTVGAGKTTNTGNTGSYSCIYHWGATAKGYFRLLAETTTGKRSFTGNILYLENPCNSNLQLLTIAPNPVRNILNIHYTSPQPSTVLLKVFDMAGQLQLQQQTTAKKGANTFIIPEIAKLPAGVYLLIISADNQTLYKQFIKQP